MSKLRPLALAIAIILSLAACGDDDSGGTASTAPTETEDLDTGDTTLPTSVGNIPGISAGCEAYADLSLAMGNVFTGGFAGFGDDLVSRLPSEGQADGAIVVGALQAFSDGLADAGIDLSQGSIGTLTQEQLQVFSDLSDNVFTDDVNAAFDRLGELVAAECAVGS